MKQSYYISVRWVARLVIFLLCFVLLPEPLTHAREFVPVPAKKPEMVAHALGTAKVIAYSLNDFKKAPPRKPQTVEVDSDSKPSVASVLYHKVADLVMPGVKPIRSMDDPVLQMADSVVSEQKPVSTQMSVRSMPISASPKQAWRGGLNAWKSGLYEQAAQMFELPAQSDKSSSWMRSASAFWAGRSWARAGYGDEAQAMYQQAAQYQDTFYGLLAAHVLDYAFDARVFESSYSRDEDAEILSLIERTQPQSQTYIDPFLVQAIVRQESLFNHKAQSNRGARGLMQIMPKTARFVARKIGVDLGSGQKRLFDPEVNLAVGQGYLAHLMNLNHVDENLVSLLVAYNAGPGNLSRWQKKWDVVDDPLLFIELIPLSETRAYVERVLYNYWVGHLKNGKTPTSLVAMNQQAYDENRSLQKGWAGLFKVAYKTNQ